MTIRRTILAAAVALASIGAARAEGPEPGQARSIDLGAVSGIAYYTVERGGFRVVATLAQRDEGAPAPVRVEAVLAPAKASCCPPRAARAPRPTRSRSAGRPTRCSSARRPRR